MTKSQRFPIPIVWLGLHIALLILLMDHSRASLDLSSLSSPLIPFFVALIGGAGIVLLARPRKFAVPGWLDRLRRCRLFYPLVTASATVLLLVLWLTPSDAYFNDAQWEFLRWYGSLAALGLWYGALVWRAADGRVSMMGWVALGAAATAGAFAVSLAFMGRFPRLNTIDELHNWIVQWTFAHTGLLGESIYRQMIPLPQPMYDTPHYLIGFMLRLFGDTFWQARFARMLLACIALPFIFLAGKRMYGARAGLFAVVVAAFLLPTTAYVRPDWFAGVMLSVTIYLYLRAQKTPRPALHFLTGLCAAVAGEGHPVMYHFAAGFGAIYVARWFYQMWRARRLSIDGRVFALALGGMLGLFIYVSIHILPGLEQALHFLTNYAPGAHTDVWPQIDTARAILLGQLAVWINTNPFEFLMVALGVALAVWQRKDGDVLLLTLLFVSEAILLVTYGYYRGEFYQVHYLPIFALLGGRLVAGITDLRAEPVPTGRLSGLVLGAMVFTVSLLSLVHSAQAAADDPQREAFTSIARQLKASLPSNAVVVGNEDYFMEMRSLNYYGIETVTTDNWFLVKYQGYQLWQVTKPDVFILSDGLDVARYIDLRSIYSYMRDNNFHLGRCYENGTLHIQVYVRTQLPDWLLAVNCPKPGWGPTY